MKQSILWFVKKLFLANLANDLRSEVVRRYTFKAINTRDESALLAVENHRLAMTFAGLREKSALFQKKDCFECLSPHIEISGT